MPGSFPLPAENHHMTQHFKDTIQLRKIFVGGLDHALTAEQLGTYFASYGPVIESPIMRDAFGASRGFGFVLFASIFSAEAALAAAPHYIYGRRVDSKRSIPRDQLPRNAPSHFRTVYPYTIGTKLTFTLPSTLTIDTIRNYFMRFGVIDQIELLKPEHKGFVIFEKEESAEKCLAGVHKVNGVHLEVQNADENDDPKSIPSDGSSAACSQ